MNLFLKQNLNIYAHYLIVTLQYQPVAFNKKEANAQKFLFEMLNMVSH